MSAPYVALVCCSFVSCVKEPYPLNTNMISFKEHLAEAFGDSAKYYKAIQTVEAALDQATRPYERQHEASWERYMGPKFRGRSGHTTVPELQFLRTVPTFLQDPAPGGHGRFAGAKYSLQFAVVWLLDFDQSTRPTTGPLSASKLKMDVAVIAAPDTGTLIVVPSIGSPRKFFKYQALAGAPVGFSGISPAVKQATASLKFFADNHHKAHYYGH